MPNGDGPSAGEIAFYDVREIKIRVKRLERLVVRVLAGMERSGIKDEQYIDDLKEALKEIRR